jgi:hypothetical protein
LQIRRAQRTYRQKKEATIQTLKTRVDQLEQTLQNVSDLLTSDDPEEFNRLTGSNDLSRARQLVLAEINKARELPEDGGDPVGQTTESLRDIFGYEVISHGRRKTSNPRGNSPFTRDTPIHDLHPHCSTVSSHPRPSTPTATKNLVYPGGCKGSA